MTLAVASTTITAAAASATNLPVPYPASIASGDFLILFVATKPFSASIATPAGWTLLGSKTDGTVAQAADIGSTLISAFIKRANGTETGSLTVIITSGNSSWGSMARITKDPTKDIQAALADGTDAVANTTLSVAFGTNPGLTAGDMLLMAIAWPTDLARTVSSSAMSASGVTFSGITAAGDQNPRVTTGNDIGGVTNHALVATGTASTAPTWTATLSVATNATGPALIVRLREFPPIEIDGTRVVTAAIAGDVSIPSIGGSAQFLMRRSSGGSALRASAFLRASGATLNADGARPITATIAGAAAVTQSTAGNLAATATITGVAQGIHPAAGTSPITATETGIGLVVHPVDGTRSITATIAGAVTSTVGPAAGNLAVTATATGVASVTRGVAGNLAVSAAEVGAANEVAGVDGTRPITATLAGAVSVTRIAAGSLGVTATLVGTAGTPAVSIDGSLSITATRTGNGSLSQLFKTLHVALGHAPSTRADMVTAFSPNTASGGWHRGDGALSIQGTNWTLFCFNDFWVSDGSGGVQSLPRRTSVFMVDHDDGQVWWLSGGDGFPIAGSTTFPSTGSGWAWLQGGWATGTNSVMLLGAQWVTGTPYTLTGYYVMGVTALTGTAPPYTPTQAINLDASGAVNWNGMPFVDSGRVCIYGLGSDWNQYVASCPITTTNPADYANWSYWDGSGWTTTFANRAPITVQSAPLRALDVIAYGGRYLASAKDFDSSPELGIPDTWTDLKVWASASPMGPWRYHGIVESTAMTNWWSYAARLELFPGMTDLSTIWSVNTDSGHFNPDIYGPQIGAPDQVGVVEVSTALAGTASVTEVGSGDRANTFTATGTAMVVAAASGTRSVAATEVGAANLVSLASGNLSITVTLTGGAVVASGIVVSGDRVTTVTSAGSATVDRAATGTLAVSAGSTATAAVTEAATGTLGITGTITGAATVTRTVTGNLVGTATITGAASTSGSADIDGTRTVNATIAGVMAITAGVSGQLPVAASITGGGVGVHPIDGARPVTVTIVGAAISAPGTSGNLSVTATEVGAVTLTLGSGGSLAVTAGITGAASVIGSGSSGSLNGTAAIVGAVTVDKFIAGDLILTSPRSGELSSNVNVGGDLSITASPTGPAHLTLTTFGSLVVIATITGDIPPTTLPSVIVVLTLEDVTLSGSINTGTSITISSLGEINVALTRVPITVTYTRIRGTTVRPT